MAKADDGHYVRDRYCVPAQIGGRVAYTYKGRREGTIVGFHGGRLMVSFDEDPDIFLYLHPTWELEYVAVPAEVRTEGGT